MANVRRLGIGVNSIRMVQERKIGRQISQKDADEGMVEGWDENRVLLRVSGGAEISAATVEWGSGRFSTGGAQDLQEGRIGIARWSVPTLHSCKVSMGHGTHGSFGAE